MTLDQIAQWRRPWRALSTEEKQVALAALRRRQRAQIEVEVRELRAVARR